MPWHRKSKTFWLKVYTKIRKIQSWQSSPFIAKTFGDFPITKSLNSSSCRLQIIGLSVISVTCYPNHAIFTELARVSNSNATRATSTRIFASCISTTSTQQDGYVFPKERIKNQVMIYSRQFARSISLVITKMYRNTNATRALRLWSQVLIWNV